MSKIRTLDDLDPRIHFLHNRSYLLPNRVRILGTTLWTHIPSESASRIGQSLADYRLISIATEKKVGDNTVKTQRLITVDDTNEWHAQQHGWLLEEIQKARDNHEHAVIITHHAPSRRVPGVINIARAAVEDAFMNNHEADCVDPVRLWVYGHTHRSADLTVNSTRIVSNQYGYTGDHHGFRPNMKIILYDDGSVTVTADVLSTL